MPPSPDSSSYTDHHRQKTETGLDFHCGIQPCFRFTLLSSPPATRNVLYEITHNLGKYLIISEIIVLDELVDVVTVVELLADTEVQHLHLRRTIVACDALAESTVKTSVLESDHHLMRELQVVSICSSIPER